MKKRLLSVFLALALCLGLAVPAFAANINGSLATNFSNLTIYDVNDGQYALGDVDADVTVFPAVCVLDRECQPIYYSSHNTHEALALTDALKPYSGISKPSEPTEPPTPPTFSGDEDSNQTGDITAQQVYQSIIALKEQYPNWTPWTNDNYYKWNGGIYSGGYGCAGFAFMLSDAAFGNLPARILTEFAFSDVRVGDILRLKLRTGGEHSVIVLEVHDNYVVIAEGNLDDSVYWGTTLTADTVLSSKYLLTRYPVDNPDPTPTDTFTDVPDWCSSAVSWAVGRKITEGVGNNRFAPGNQCTNAMILTFLWRAAGEPGSTAALPVDITGKNLDYAETALRWAAEKGMIDETLDPAANCTRASAVSYIWQALGKESAPASGFNDVPAGADYAAAVDWASASGIVEGYPDGSFHPDTVCSRGVIAAMLHRAYVPSVRL